MVFDVAGGVVVVVESEIGDGVSIQDLLSVSCVQMPGVQASGAVVANMGQSRVRVEQGRSCIRCVGCMIWWT